MRPRPPWCSIFIVGAIAALGCTRPNEYKAPPPPEVTVAQPVEQEVVHEMEFTGTTRAPQAVDIRARINGYLHEVNFKDGANVKAGDVLFVIESEPFEATLDAANASLQKAEASLELANAEFARTEPLVKRGAVPESELDVKRADVATSKADVAAAKAAIRQADLNLSYTKVKAPINGRVSRHLVDVGNLVQAETTLLTRVEAYDPIHAYFTISESDVLEFIRLSGELPSVQQPPANGPKLFLGLTGEKGFPHEGRLDFAEIGVDPDTGTQMRRGEFPNPDGKLVPGLFVRIRLPIGSPTPQLLVPDRAIATDQQGEYVLAVNDKNVVEYRPVELGTRVGDQRVVFDGIKLDDWIVVNGIQRARPGAPVNPQREAKQQEVTQTAATTESPPAKKSLP
jgi:RND family efflux transporter MFP subunit